MKIHPQTIYHGKQPAFVVLPFDEYSKLLETMEEFCDIEAVTKHIKNVDETFPLNLVSKLAEGENPIKLFREYRGINQTALAEKIGKSRQYISQLEKGDRAGTVKILQTIAKTLNIDLEDIV